MINALKELTHTLAVEEENDYTQWHKNREHYAVWAIEVDDPVILEEVHKARDFFKDMLLQSCDRQPHVTLFVSGFLAEHVIHDDDYALNQQRAQQQALSTLMLKPFEIKISGLSSFASALYWEVTDTSGSIEKIREALGSVMPELRWKPYIPHITIGFYCKQIPVEEVIQRINAYQQPPNAKQHVTEIKLMSYIAQELVGPLTVRSVHTLTP